MIVWLKRLFARKALPDKQIRLINDHINAFRYVKEPVEDGTWLQYDNFKAYGGDCESFAMNKVMLLRDAGYSDANMQFCRIFGTKRDHAVCLVDGWILDNRIKGPLLYQDAKKVYDFELYAAQNTKIYG